MSKFANVFHAFFTKLGIKNSKQNLALKYHGYLHKYIQDEMDFLDISSFDVPYRYAIEIKQKFKQNKRDFGSMNLKEAKGTPKQKKNGQIQGGVNRDNPSKTKLNKSTTKTNKDMGNCYQLHKIPTHNTSECPTKQSLIAELKAFK